ncbi:unnamed protein product [Calypogeia fissa]
MLGVARFFWRRYVTQARQFIETIWESDRERYQSETEIINRVEALYLHYSQKGELDERYLEIVRPEYIADLFFQGGRLLPLDEALEVLATDFYRLPGCGYLSKYVFWEVAVKGMDHIPVVEKERAVREGRAVHDMAGISNPPTGSDRPPTPKAPRWAEPDRVATPPEELVGEEALDDVLSDITAGPEDLGPHEDPEGLTLGDNAEALGLAGQGDNQEPEVIILDSEENTVPEGDKAPEEDYAPEDNAPRNKEEEEEMQISSIPRDIVREAEEVRGGSNWAKHLFKQLHHELEVAKTTKKCKAGSHIRIIFLALEREKKKKEAAKEDAPPGFPAPQGTKVL